MSVKLEYKVGACSCFALASKRTFNSTIKANNKYNAVIPLVTYNNIENQKVLILKSNKGKAGIYR